MITNDYQKLEPGNEIRLFEIDATVCGCPDKMYFHEHLIPYTEEELISAGFEADKLRSKSIWWQGEEYKPWPCHYEGRNHQLPAAPRGLNYPWVMSMAQ